VSLATHSGFAAPSHAACLPKADATRQKQPFPKKLKIRGGNLKKCKGFFSGGCAVALRHCGVFIPLGDIVKKSYYHNESETHFFCGSPHKAAPHKHFGES